MSETGPRVRQRVTAPLDHSALLAAPGRGRRSVETLEALERRNALLCVAAANYCAGLRANAAATKLADALTRYRSAGWRRECTAETCPMRHAGTLRELLWCILRTRDAPLSARTIRRALADSANQKNLG